jgi:hypothetical protein
MRPPLQTISTRDIGPTDTKPARISAATPFGYRLIVSRHIKEDYFEAHATAARILANRLNWTEEFIPGVTRDGYCFVVDCGVRV